MASTSAVAPEIQKENRVHRLLLFVEYLYLMRFPLLAAVILAAGLPCGFVFAPSMFVGLFDAGRFWGYSFIVFMEFQLAWSIMITIRLILVYGRDRFKSLADLGWQEPQEIHSLHLASFGLLAVPSLVLTWIGSEDIHVWAKLGGTLLGMAASLLILLFAGILHFRIERGAGVTVAKVLPWVRKYAGYIPKSDWEKNRWRFWKAMDRAFGRLPHEMTDGLMRDDSRPDGTKLRYFRSGHEVAFGLFLVLVLVYALGFFYAPNLVSGHRQPAALFYLLFLLVLSTWFFYLAAFILDRFRLPVLTTLLLLSLATGFFRTDHIYNVVESPKHDELLPGDVIRKWDHGPRQGFGRPLTVVATAGGGIQASAWTAQVLSGLQQECGPDKFSSSLLLVSSVSGGSVGAMYALAPYDSSGNYPTDPERLRRIRGNANRSSLSAAGWGMLYPDGLRTVMLLGSLVPQHWDAGWALENAWINDWSNPPNLNDWRADVQRGTRPAVIFNATAAESGERFLISTTELKTAGGMQFGRDYNGWDLPIARAARLSATFPYVSPIARASSANQESERVHVADGGYYDNSGLLGALNWLNEAKSDLNGRTVILITIDSKSGAPAAGKSWSWQKQLVAPISTMLSLRTSSQHYRADFESALVRESLVKNGVNVVSAQFNYSGDMPLSWHLNATQKRNVEKAWESRTATDDIRKAKQVVFAALGCQEMKVAEARK